MVLGFFGAFVIGFLSTALPRMLEAPGRGPTSAFGTDQPPFRNSLVPKGGLEPPRPYGQRILSPLRLPFRHLGT